MTEAGPTCSRVPSSRYPLALLGFFLLLCVLMHAKSFSVSHIEGDEIVYLTLAREMNWDFSGYSTQHDAAVRRFPHSIYRQELFHHPLLPRNSAGVSEGADLSLRVNTILARALPS